MTNKSTYFFLNKIFINVKIVNMHFNCIAIINRKHVFLQKLKVNENYSNRKLYFCS